MNLTLASYITLLRIVLIAPIASFIYFGGLLNSILALLFFLIASITDYLDGYIARKTSTETDLGATLDLYADKLLIIIVLIFINAAIDDTLLIALSSIIIIREFILIVLRHFKTLRGRLKVRALGKLKTSIQMIAISMLLIAPYAGTGLYYVALSLTAIAALISTISLIDYLRILVRDD